MPNDDKKTIQEVLESTMLGTLLWSKRNLHEVEFDGQITVLDVMNKLNEMNVLSLPCFEMVEKAGVKVKEFRGYISCWDLLLHFVSKCGPNEKVTKENLGLNALASSLKLTEESSVVYFDDPTSSVSSIMEPMTTNLHRLLVRQERFTRNLRMITREDIINFIHNRCINFPIMKQTIQELGLAQPRDIPSVEETMTAFQAFHRMKELGCNAIAIVSEEGVLKSVLSSSDLRGMAEGLIDSLNLPVLEFIKHVHYGSITPVVIVVPGTPLHVAMAHASMPGVYRVWVVDENHKPISFISLRTILSLFKKQE